MAEGEGFRISGLDSRAAVQLKAYAPPLRSGKAGAGRSYPSLVPPTLGGRVRVLGLGPGEWLAVSDTIEGATLCEALRQHLKGTGIVAVDLSSCLKGLRVEGASAREVLGKGCGLDLHPQSFPAGHCTRTRFAQLAVILECRDRKACFELYVRRSYMSYLRAWLADASAEFAERP